MSKGVDFLRNLSPASGGRGHHSPLFRWFRDNAETVRQLLENASPSWDAIAEALAREGLTNGDGQPLTRRRVQKTWYAVKRAQDRAAGRQQAAQAVASAVAPIVEAKAASPLPDAPTATPAPRTFQPSTMRNYVPPASPPSPIPAAPKPQVPPDPDHADRVIAAMLSGGARTRFRTDTTNED